MKVFLEAPRGITEPVTVTAGGDKKLRRHGRHGVVSPRADMGERQGSRYCRHAEGGNDGFVRRAECDGRPDEQLVPLDILPPCV